MVEDELCRVLVGVCWHVSVTSIEVQKVPQFPVSEGNLQEPVVLLWSLNMYTFDTLLCGTSLDVLPISICILTGKKIGQ